MPTSMCCRRLTFMGAFLMPEFYNYMKDKPDFIMTRLDIVLNWSNRY